MLDRPAVLGGAGLLAVPAQAGSQNKSGVINAMMTDDPAALCYPLFNTRIMQEICGNINESLLLFDWQFRPHPNLAQAFDMSPDGLTYVFHLRPDVVWHDGGKFTSHDVAFSCGTMLPQLNPPSRNPFPHIPTIQTPHPHTPQFPLPQPF